MAFNPNSLSDQEVPEMTVMDAIAMIEGDISPETEQQLIEAWQLLHDTRVGYSLQGRYGRMLKYLIENGEVTP